MEALRTYLRDRNLTQADFAKQIGVTQPAVAMIVNGVHSPSVRLLRRISEETGISADELLASSTNQVAVRHG